MEWDQRLTWLRGSADPAVCIMFSCELTIDTRLRSRIDSLSLTTTESQLARVREVTQRQPPQQSAPGQTGRPAAQLCKEPPT